MKTFIINHKKAIIISSIAIGGTILTVYVVFEIKRYSIRKRLDEAYNDPSGAKSVGGLDKLVVSGAFDINRYAQSGKATITLVEAREKAQLVWENYSSWFSSNQTAIVNAFNGLGHLDDVSKIAHEFKAQYDEDLGEALKTALTEKSKYNILIGIINKLPTD